MSVLYVDQFNRNVVDVTEHYAEAYEGVVKAERCEGNVLVLFETDDQYELSYRWLVTPDADLTRVLGSELSQWDKSEVDPTESLFKHFSLIS